MLGPMVRKTLASAGILLAAFHVWLFIGQMWTGELADVSLVARWALAGGLVWGLVGLRRQGASILWGRKAVALWLLAALLHGPAVAERAGMLDAPAVPEVVATVVATTLAVVGVGLAILFGFRNPRQPTITRAAATTRRSYRRLTAFAPASFLVLAPRPPPQVAC
jgi:hypothetical protein